MPRRARHIKDGLLVGGAVGVLWNTMGQLNARSNDPNRPFDWQEVFIHGAAGAAAGGVAATLPDLLEPADHPYHRAFFHSATAGSLVLYATSPAQNGHLSALAQTSLLAGGAGYAAHLAADSLTPHGIRLL